VGSNGSFFEINSFKEN